MTKSINISILDSKYTEAISNLWDASVDMLTYSQNTLGEIYRISSIVRLFAKGKAKIDSLRDLLADGQQKKDLYTLKRVAYLAERMQEEKALEKFWDKVAKEYDKIISDFVQQQANDDIIVEIPTSEEILAQCSSNMEESRANQINLAAETAAALINL